jgi:hypothetical protein
VARIMRKWKPYGGLIYFHLLLDRLAKAGYLQPQTGCRTAARRLLRVNQARDN